MKRTDEHATMIPSRAKLLDVGEAVPWFTAAALSGNPRYIFDSAAGRPLLMLFMGRGSWAPSAAALALIARHQALFDDRQASFFGITVDPDDAARGRIAQRIPGIRWFLDYDGLVSRAYGASQEGESGAGYIPHWLLVDTTLRVVARERRDCRVGVGDDERYDLERNADHVVIDSRAVGQLDVCELQPNRVALVQRSLPVHLPARHVPRLRAADPAG